MKRLFLILLIVFGSYAVAEESKQEKSYRKLKFSVISMQRVNDYEGTKASDGNEIVVVKTMIDRTNFSDDFRGNECKLDRAMLFDVERNVYKSFENQRRITEQLKDEYGRVYGDAKMPFDWSFEVPKGTRLKTFQFEFDDEHVFTGGEDPDENVHSLSFDLEGLEKK